jgi:hypothetical protein
MEPVPFPPELTPNPAWFIRANGFDASRGSHGLGHTRRVMLHARAIAQAEGFAAWEAEAAVLAALWHDLGRTGDGVDYYHGAKSAGKVLALNLHAGFSSLVVETALHAVVHHSGAEEHGTRAAYSLEYYGAEGGAFRRRFVPADAALRVFRALKDADALDRVRLGNLDERYLRFESAKGRVAAAWALLAEVQ